MAEIDNSESRIVDGECPKRHSLVVRFDFSHIQGEPELHAHFEGLATPYEMRAAIVAFEDAIEKELFRVFNK